MAGHVVFALSARIRLMERYAELLATKPQDPSVPIADLEQRLKAIFPEASVVLVQELYVGFRRREGEFVLLVEISRDGQPIETAVVKLASAERLQQEFDGWNCCRPPGLRHDLVLLPLERVPPLPPVEIDLPPGAKQEPVDITALVYGDAQQLIGVDQTLTLEAAMLDAVRHGAPTVTSVADLLFQLYERLGLLLYRHCFDATAACAEGVCAESIDPHLLKNLERWDRRSGLAFELRARVTTELDPTPQARAFRDPVAMLRHILRQTGAQATASVPRMLRGRAHGDLHGRNVLVGRVGERVLWPAVFDYGDMRANNLIAWDFVKMETELKIRAFAALFRTDRSTLDVVNFEVKLHEATERGRDRDDWASLPATPTPVERLHWLLLQLRRSAMSHLSQLGRGRQWLMEYYFVLTVYGLNSVRFDNLSPVEQTGAFLSSGCAAARYAWDLNNRSRGLATARNP